MIRLGGNYINNFAVNHVPPSIFATMTFFTRCGIKKAYKAFLSYRKIVTSSFGRTETKSMSIDQLTQLLQLPFLFFVKSVVFLQLDFQDSNRRCPPLWPIREGLRTTSWTRSLCPGSLRPATSPTSTCSASSTPSRRSSASTGTCLCTSTKSAGTSFEPTTLSLVFVHLCRLRIPLNFGLPLL